MRRACLPADVPGSRDVVLDGEPRREQRGMDAEEADRVEHRHLRENGRFRRPGYRRTNMARPVTRPSAGPNPGGRSLRSRRSGVVLATMSGVVLVAAGWFGFASASPAGGSPSSPPGVAASPSDVARASPPESVGPPPSAGASPSASPSLGPSASDTRAALEARLQATLDRVRVKLGIPGISTTILFPDGSAWTGVSGLADVAGNTPVAPMTAFAVASMSKTFTSAEILALVGEGRLRLTDQAVRLVPPGLPITLDRRITIAMLLDHTSGLSDYFLNPKIDPALRRLPTRTWTPADALRFVGKPLAKPGAAWHYANTNYLLLGLIAERVTGHTLADEIRTRFLDPLGLHDIWYQAVENPREPLAHGYRFAGTKPTARPIDLSDGTDVAPFRSVVTAAGGAGSIAATSVDLARWARALYGGDVLGPTGTALLLSDFNKTTGYLPGVSYGFGVQALTIDGHASLGHSGRLLGFQGAVRHFPIDGFTIAVLTNQSRADPGAVVRSLLHVVAPPPAPPVAPPSASPSASVSPSGSGSPALPAVFPSPSDP
jgi:D-alanyl-D-alanine carboxypeptidase